MRFKIYYDDLSTFSSEDGPWDEAPADGILYVVSWVDGKKDILSGADFYFLHDGAIGSTSDLGPLQRKLGFIKFGRWTSHKNMERAAQMVREDS